MAFAASPPGRAVSEQDWVENNLSFDLFYPVLLSLAASCTQTQRVLCLQESPRVPRAASPAQEPGAHRQISHSLVCFLPVLTEQPPALFTLCCSHAAADTIICVLRSFSGLLGAVASTDFANSHLPSVHISELRGGTKGPFYRHRVGKL